MNTKFTPQLDLLGGAAENPVLAKAVAAMAAADDRERGAVFTRPETVAFILDLTGYTSDKLLYKQRLLEPSFGHGEFLKAAVERLLASWTRRHRKPVTQTPAELLSAIRAVELHDYSFDTTRAELDAQLKAVNFPKRIRDQLLDTWLVRGDFLLSEIVNPFDYVVGNPPYVRQESIPPILLAEYRRRFRTLYDRADLYVLFYEKSLEHLAEGGQLGFICSDRWIKNKYGGPLRNLVASEYHLKIFVDMFDTKAFNTEVIAYPAITVIERAKSGPTRLAVRPEVESATLARLVPALRDGKRSVDVRDVATLPTGTPWVMEANPTLDLVRKLEAAFPPIEEVGCKVGIGVATGADSVFIAPLADLDVEPSRKLPLVRTKDILSGNIEWGGDGVLNPFEDDGSLADLKRYPKFAAYIHRHGSVLRARHVAQKSQVSWYRTIDRITPSLLSTPKLLVPDIKGEANIVFDEGNYYPHHNLYFITSESWDIRALQTVLRSGIARLFVAAYSTKMRGGYLRYQAQYLRRIRLPAWSDVPLELRKLLMSPNKDGLRYDVVGRLYGLDESEIDSLKR